MRVVQSLAALHIHDLACADVGEEQVRPQLDHIEADDRAPRYAQEGDLVRMQVLAEVLCNLVAVAHNLFNGEIWIDAASCPAKSLACAGLIPLDDDEILFQLGWHKCAAGCPGTAVSHEQHWIGALLTTDGDPLLDAANRYKHRFVDTIRRANGACVGILAPSISAVR